MKYQSNLFIIALLLVNLTLFHSCKKDKTTMPLLTTADVLRITVTTAVCGGSIDNDGGASIVSRGICWNSTGNPTIADNKTIESGGDGSFTSSLTALTPNTKYVVRAYATNRTGTGYGNARAFITEAAIDIDSNFYHSVTIGTQVWMVENLKTTKYRNGDPILNVTDGAQWIKSTTGAYCNYNNDTINATTYGRLYNWYAVIDSRNIAPLGWHVTSNAEWTALKDYLGGEPVAGGKMKSTSGWIQNDNGTNTSGFTALPGGFRFINGEFQYIGIQDRWWTSDEYDATWAFFNFVTLGGIYLGRGPDFKINGFSVRCIKDN